MNAAITFENVEFRYQPQAEPLRLNIGFPQDSVTAIVGRSGSGKSTLLQLINGLLQPDRGTVRVMGQPIDYTHITLLRRKIGYMVQAAGLFPHLTIEQNIGLSARISQEPVSVSRIDALMTKMALPLHFKQRHPYQLSGGEQQRAVICMAMYGQPPILLMDESLGSLDSITRVEIQNQLLAMQAEEKYTMVMVTHDLQEALRFGDFLLVLNEGNVEAYGPPRDVQASASALVQKLFSYARTQLNPSQS